ncbi:MAG: hypothetical protein Ct9H300mP31_13670 [Acidimicrobiaceae bacterium]|nr:MAG: hypothetical protein Ct9H300mP31_13670 [Acidimicrobiaceae bacterium]
MGRIGRLLAEVLAQWPGDPAEDVESVWTSTGGPAKATRALVVAGNCPGPGADLQSRETVRSERTPPGVESG